MGFLGVRGYGLFLVLRVYLKIVERLAPISIVEGMMKPPLPAFGHPLPQGERDEMSGASRREWLPGWRFAYPGYGC
ncbi:MAG: hypothetical protein FWC38_06035 [Proteobacteria bacterium]|nr:hypothetical protein [Pseudomonadota bacterium]MCL2307770.1 hypothetical protein [Pseudomonadota bacterium]